MADNIGNWKREIIREQEKPNIREKTIPGIVGLNDGDILDMGNALEIMTQTQGWLVVESWIYQATNPKRILSLKTDFERGSAAGKMSIMDQVAAMIKARDEIIKREEEKEAKKTEEKKEGGGDE